MAISLLFHVDVCDEKKAFQTYHICKILTLISQNFHVEVLAFKLKFIESINLILDINRKIAR